jgi:isopenicillin-N N-acyltransferase-like protein
VPLLAHVSTEASPADRGRAFGLAHEQAVESTVAAYRRLFAETCDLGGIDVARFGARVAETLAERCPHVLDEILGLAAGAGVPEAELVAINARTELLGGTTEPECSVIASEPCGTPRSPCLLAQTWDWHPALEPSRVLWTVHQSTDSWFVTVTEAGILAKIGLNSSGIGCGLNFLTSAADGGAHGLPIHVLLRLVLSDCSNLGAALELLLNAPAAASSCITVAYADAEGGAVFGIEVGPRGSGVVGTSDDGLFVHTNHFLGEPIETTDVGVLRWPGTLIRLAHLRRRLRELPGGPDETALRSLLESHFAAPESVCKHELASDAWADKRRTLVAVVMNLTEPSFAISDGPPCQRRWAQVTLPSGRAVAAEVA